MKEFVLNVKRFDDNSLSIRLLEDSVMIGEHSLYARDDAELSDVEDWLRNVDLKLLSTLKDND